MSVLLAVTITIVNGSRYSLKINYLHSINTLTKKSLQKEKSLRSSIFKPL